MTLRWECPKHPVIVVVLLLMGSAVGVGESVTASEKAGELRIEGEGIELLTLRTAAGARKTLDRPGSMVTLPAGDYCVDSIRLEGGHSTSSAEMPAELRFVVRPGSPAALKAGAPLRQAIKVQRQGSSLVLGYELIGQGGERYRVGRNQGAATPGFAVYRGDRKVASGQFEFG